jgi:hypothetical protein
MFAVESIKRLSTSSNPADYSFWFSLSFTFSFSELSSMGSAGDETSFSTSGIILEALLTI